MACSEKELHEATDSKTQNISWVKLLFISICSKKTMKMYKPVYFMTIFKYEMSFTIKCATVLFNCPFIGNVATMIW